MIYPRFLNLRYQWKKSAAGRILSLELTEGKTKGTEDKRKEKKRVQQHRDTGNDWETKPRLKREEKTKPGCKKYKEPHKKLSFKVAA